jgi:hypothetical protein
MVGLFGLILSGLQNIQVYHAIMLVRHTGVESISPSAKPALAQYTALVLPLLLRRGASLYGDCGVGMK